MKIIWVCICPNNFFSCFYSNRTIKFKQSCNCFLWRCRPTDKTVSHYFFFHFFCTALFVMYQLYVTMTVGYSGFYWHFVKVKINSGWNVICWVKNGPRQKMKREKKNNFRWRNEEKPHYYFQTHWQILTQMRIWLNKS